MLHRKAKNILSYFFALLFILYTGGNILFTHVHEVNGTFIIHSHPGKTGHSHSSSGLATIFSLTHFASSDSIAPLYRLTPYLVLLGALWVPSRQRRTATDGCKANGWRAPPAA